jgi:hypothetical protein
LFGVEEIAPGLVEPGSVYGLLAEHREELFPPGEWDDLFAPGKGRASVPGPVVAAAMVLQALEGCSDRVAAQRLTFDLWWKAAVGMSVNARSFHDSLFCYYRRRIADSADPDRVFGSVARVVAQCGALRGKTQRVVDSTIVDDAVARQSTVDMIVWQVHRVRGLLPGIAGWVDCLPGRAWYADRSRPDIDWSDRAARQDLVSLLVADAIRIVDRAGQEIGWQREAWEAARAEAVARGEQDPGPAGHLDRLEDQVGLLAVVSGQDVEPADGSDGTDGRWRIAKRTAPDRIISLVDVEARHARKTRGSQDQLERGSSHLGLRCSHHRPRCIPRDPEARLICTRFSNEGNYGLVRPLNPGCGPRHARNGTFRGVPGQISAGCRLF